MDLLRCSGYAERGRYSYYEWQGQSIRVYDSAKNTLILLKLFGDAEVDPLTKESLVFEILFVDPAAVRANVPELNGLITMLMWELCGLDIDGTHNVQAAEKIFEWEQDEDVIKASFYRAYSRPWDEISAEVSYKDVIALIGMIPGDTPLGQALYYRTAEPPAMNDHNREVVQQFLERQEFWALKDEQSVTDRMEAMNNRATDMFNALARAAEAANNG